jgi:MFS family permease
MVVYTGLYLHTHLGMPWTGIGIVLTVMLLPFPLIEYPLGRISDTIVGEKELLAAGFIIAGAVTMAIPWLHSTSVLVWSVMLCATRIGAAIVEIMTETYFFKQVDARDAEMIGAYRIVEPCAYILAPAAASLLLRAADIRFIFLILGIVMLAGVYPALRLRDTK